MKKLLLFMLIFSSEALWAESSAQYQACIDNCKDYACATKCFGGDPMIG